MDSTKTAAAMGLVALAGITCASGGLSSGRWNESHAVSHYIDLRPALISAPGVGLLRAGGMLGWQEKTSEALEARQAALEPDSDRGRARLLGPRRAMIGGSAG